MSYIKSLLIKPGHKVRLSKIDPDFTAGFKDDQSTQDKMAKHTARLRDLQYHLYAEGKQSLLICLQGLDGAGKDGTINHVLGAMNPQGTQVHGFKVPSKEEAAHDFLWRVHKVTPGKGTVTIFNRSHYEDVLVVRVHNLVPKSVWSQRYEMINEFERTLVSSGTRILKFYLHISPEEQLKRFAERLKDPARHWKISESDYSERQLWPEYTKAYEDCLSKTSTKHAPWYAIPSNNKWFRNLAVGKIVMETMREMKMKIPAPTIDIDDIERKYAAAVRSAKKMHRELNRID
ncbi:MAG: polyphosphate kinase 2 family protein [Bdellovibrionales bacterium]|nr:polyphosphate kinase 2 family protein [Bdellovibrionales bacterium]